MARELAYRPADHRCPFCDYRVPPDLDEHAARWAEVAHMNVAHENVLFERVRRDPLDFEAGFGRADDA